MLLHQAAMLRVAMMGMHCSFNGASECVPREFEFREYKHDSA
jgi:hypothetical protein